MPRDIWPARLDPHPRAVPRGHKLRAITDGDAWLIAWTQKGGGINHVHVPRPAITVTRSNDCVTCGGGNAVGAWDPRPHLRTTPPTPTQTPPTLSANPAHATP